MTMHRSAIVRLDMMSPFVMPVLPAGFMKSQSVLLQCSAGYGDYHPGPGCPGWELAPTPTGGSRVCQIFEWAFRLFAKFWTTPGDPPGPSMDLHGPPWTPMDLLSRPLMSTAQALMVRALPHPSNRWFLTSPRAIFPSSCIRNASSPGIPKINGTPPR
jgi:hypothetical protein